MENDDLYFGEDTIIKIENIVPNYSMVFNNGDGVVAKLNWNDGILKYSGNIEKSAKVFLEFFKPYLDEYVKFKLKEKEKMKSKVLTKADLIRLSELTQRRDKIDAEVTEIYGGVQYVNDL